MTNRLGGSYHFVKPHDPRTLVRSDGLGADWAPRFTNYPTSRAQELPPSRLLGYNAMDAQRRGAATPRTTKKSVSKARRSKTRSASGNSEISTFGSKWTIEPADQGNGGLSNAVKAAQRDGDVEDDIFWIGTLGFPTDSLEETSKSEIAESLESDWDALPVFVSDSDFDGHYLHFCKVILWPVFHYQIPDHPKSKAYQDHSWVYYENLNQAIADKVVKSYKRGDEIWIHDYHLLLVPGMVRKKLPDAKIGFFLHTAFPSSEVFRCLAVRKQLLEGMLGANLIAFQSMEYQEHFLTTCSRLLVVEATENGVQLEDRFVNTISLPIGIDPKGLMEARDDEEVKKLIEEMKEQYKGKRLIVSRDKLDQVWGVRQKLLSYELFLNKYPQFKEDVVLIQIATSTPENNSLGDVITEIATRIDSNHATLSHQPLVLLRQDIAIPTYLSLLSVADVLLNTSLREGMNLTCHEFIICQDGEKGGKAHGPVILSEFTGSSSIFQGNDLSINPWDYQKVAQAIKTALEMQEPEKTRRYDNIYHLITKNTGGKWVSKLNELLNTVHAEQQQQDNAAIPRLSVTQLTDKYQSSKKRVFFLDYEGTLATLTRTRNVHISTPQRALDVLNHILLDSRNIVYIMSGQSSDELESNFGRLQGVGLIAENGCWVRCHNDGDRTSFPDEEKSAEWKKSVKSIMQYYHERIPGSTVSERRFGMTFSYNEAEDEDAAARQAGECANHINDACSSQRIHAVPGEKYIIVEPTDWNKATAAQYVFDELRKKDEDHIIDWLFIAGDDRQDEGVFKWANKLGSSGVVQNVTTVSLGKRNTEAGATLTQGTSGKSLDLYEKKITN